MISLFHRLPLGGKLLAKQGDEGQPNNNQAFFSKSRFITNPHSWLPLRGSCRLLPTEEVFVCPPLSLRQAFPLPEKKFSKLHFFGKNCQPLRAFPFSPRSPLPKHSRPYSFFVVISRLSSLRLFPSASIPVFHPTRSFQKPFLLAILSLRIVVFAGSTIIIS